MKLCLLILLSTQMYASMATTDLSKQLRVSQRGAYSGLQRVKAA